jgi:hypothetical protein
LIALGYATNAKPGPLSATLLMGTFAVFAIKPSTENITNPDNRHVPSLKQANISVSLKETHKSK